MGGTLGLKAAQREPVCWHSQGKLCVGGELGTGSFKSRGSLLGGGAVACSHRSTVKTVGKSEV